MNFDVIQQSFLSIPKQFRWHFCLSSFVRAPLLGIRNATRDSLPNLIYKNLGNRHPHPAPLHHSAAAFAVASPRRLDSFTH